MAEKANLAQSLQADKELALVARNQFQQIKYEDSLQTLSKIKLDAKSPDPKVLHNQAIAQYYLGNCTEPKKLLEELAKIKKRLEEKLQEQEDETDEVQGLIYEDADANIILYNTAVINYQLRQYATSLSILENLFQNIEPMDENLAVRICLLLGELYLNLKYNKDKVSLVIGYLEKTFPQFISSDKKETESDKDESQQSTSTLIDITPSEFRYHLHMLKAKLFVLQKNQKSAKREIKLALATQHPNLSNTVLLVSCHLKAYLEYQQGNFTKAIKLLNSFQKSNEKHVAVMYFNNLGCIHYKMKKYHAAAVYFTRALAEGEKDTGGMTSFARSKRLQVLYNMGNKLLFTGNPELAFKCFQESSLLYYKQPKLWLRLAECCVGSHVKKMNETQRSKNFKTPMMKKVTGQSSTKRIVLPTQDSHTKGLIQEDQEITDDTLQVQFGTLSLEYALKSIRNCLFLLARIEGQATTTVTLQPNVPLSAIPANNSSVGDEETLSAMKLAAWSTGAYVALSCNNPVVALQYAKELLNYKKSMDYHKFLANQYAATALCMLNKPNDALSYLNPQALAEFTMPTSPYTLSNSDPLNNPKYILLVNFAIVNIMKDDLTQAQNAVNQALGVSRSTSAVLLQVYLELRRGNNEAALQLLKINSGVNFSSPKQSVNE